MGPKPVLFPHDQGSKPKGGCYCSPTSVSASRNLQRSLPTPPQLCLSHHTLQTSHHTHRHTKHPKCPRQPAGNLQSLCVVGHSLPGTPSCHSLQTPPLTSQLLLMLSRLHSNSTSPQKPPMAFLSCPLASLWTSCSILCASTMSHLLYYWVM